MNRIADLLCAAGLVLLGYALWRVNPALAYGFGGIMVAWCGVWLKMKPRSKGK